MIDFIGDIHGHADKLEGLLLQLGYIKSGNTYSHPNRKVLFVGDYIDRGPKIRETLAIVKAMVDSDNAIAGCTIKYRRTRNRIIFPITYYCGLYATVSRRVFPFASKLTG